MNLARQISTDETLLRLAEVPDAIPGPKPGKKTSFESVNRWVVNGLSGVQLEVLFVGGIRFTSREALGRFFEAVSVARGQKRRPATVSPAAARAKERLKAEGF